MKASLTRLNNGWIPDGESCAGDGAQGLDWNLWRDGHVLGWLYRTPWGDWKASGPDCEVGQFATLAEAAAWVQLGAKASAPAAVP